MSATLALNDFCVTKLNIGWNQPPDDPERIRVKVNVDYQVMQHKQDSRRFRLNLNVTVRPANAKAKSGWNIDADIHGDFTFPEDFEETLIPTAIRVNGSSILFGTLRGQIANATGSFPPGKFVLPAVAMQDIVMAKEKPRTERAPGKKSQPKARK